MEFTKLLAIFSFSLLIALSLLTVTSISDKNQLQTEHQREILALQGQLDDLQDELSVTKQSAEGKDSTLDRLQQRLSNAEELQQQCNEANDEVLSTVNAYEKDLSQKIEWLAANSQLDVLPSTKVHRASERCLIEQSNSCTISMACLFAANRLDLGYTYLADPFTSGESDKLQSLVDMDANGGGDCEDWSILTAAQVRYLQERCSHDTVHVESFVPQEGAGTYIISEEDGWEYSNGFSPFKLGEFPHVAIACGHMRISPNGQQATLDGSGIVAGHCLLVFTKEQITDENIHRVTQGAPLVEPQLGNFYGRIGSKIQLVDNKADEDKTALWMFVTDDNIISNLNGEWTSYQTLLGSIQSLR